MKTLVLLLIFTHTLLAFHLHEKKDETDKTPFIDRTLNKVENKLEYVYDKLNSSSKYVDELLTNEKDNQIYEDSYIRIEYFNKIQTKGDNDSELDVDIKFKLPKLKKKLSFQLTNTDDKINKKYSDSNEKSINEDNKYSVGLLYDTFKNKYDLKFKTGIKLTSDPYLFVQAKAEKNFKLNFNSSILVKEKIRYSTKDKFDNNTSFEYKYNYNSKIHISNFFEYHINSEDKINNYYSSIRLNKTPSKSKYINYVASYSSTYDSSYRTNQYRVYSSYRKYIRKWLYYDLVPEIQWNRSNDFDENYILKINLGVLIAK